MFYNNLERVYTEFLPTPSARRATRRKAADVLTVRISTHALREEGDGQRVCPADHRGHFYPRPPRGGRRGQHLR